MRLKIPLDKETFTCHVSAANPSVSEYRFYRNDTVIKTLQYINKYTIHDVQRSQHYGKYNCVAHNDAGDGDSDAVDLNINGKLFVLGRTVVD